MSGPHTMKIGGKIGNPHRRSVADMDHMDRWYVNQLRWQYRTLRREGVRPSTARMLVHHGWCIGFTAGLPPYGEVRS